MKKIVVAAALVAAVLHQPTASAAPAGRCYSQTAIEAEEGLRFLTDLMIASTACRDTTYGMFELRNKDAVIAYQKALIAHFHGNAAFDNWSTTLANEASLKHAGKPMNVVCQQFAELIKTASSLDSKGFRAYAAAQAVSAAARYPKCGK